MSGEVLTVQAFAAFVPIPNATTALEPVLADLIAVATEEAEGFCDRAFGKADDWVERLDGNDSRLLILRRPPVRAISEVAILDDDGNDEVLDPSEYQAAAEDDNDGRLLLLSGRFPAGRGNIRVTYDAGFATYPKRLIHGVREIALGLWYARGKDPRVVAESSQGGSSTRKVDRSGLPDSAVTALLPFCLPTVFTAEAGRSRVPSVGLVGGFV